MGLLKNEWSAYESQCKKPQAFHTRWVKAVSCGADFGDGRVVLDQFRGRYFHRSVVVGGEPSPCWY